MESLASALAIIHERLLGAPDLTLAPLKGGMAVYIDGMVRTPLDGTSMERFLGSSGLKPVRGLYHFTQELSTAEALIQALLSGQVVLLQDGDPIAQGLQLHGGERRSIQEPEGERVIRGPREGFVESIRTNTALIRRRLMSPALRIEASKVGRLTPVAVNLLWFEGIASLKLVSEVRSRLEKVDLEAVLDSGYIEEVIQDRWYSPFPQILYTERPDIAVANLLEGRVVLLVDGSPSALVMPAIFASFMQANEDYYERWQMGVAVRVLRYTFMFVALTLPSLFIAATTFQPQMFPTPLFESVAGLRESVPFPALVEAALMEVTFEVMRESGLRLPSALGQAISIVGALVIGDAAVRAGLVSPLMVIVVAITGLANFMIPRYNFGEPIRLLRFPLMLLTGLWGMIGLGCGLCGILLHLCSLKSFGVPYLSPEAPPDWSGMLDHVIRAPHKLLQRRARRHVRVQR